jgi:hypothetical protein
MSDIPASLSDLDASGSQPETDDAGRLVVAAANRNPVDVADEVAAWILDGNDPPGLFSMSPAAVVLRNGTLVPLDTDGWLLYVARRVTFTVPAKGGSHTIAPPAAVMKLIPPVVIPELPALDGIVTSPYLDHEGNVIASDGYNPETHLYLHAGGFQVPAVSARPTGEDVGQAVKLLAREWLGDFPFAGDADRANALAVLLTLTGRMFFSLAPLTVFDASTAGSGKGLLATTISLIATGGPPEVMELPADGEEQRKKITSALLAGHELIMWDESHVIQGRTLAAILTAERYSDRLLGGNKLISVNNRFTQVALGNNVEVWGDMRRRVIPARLVPDSEHPEDRDDFRHPDLPQWVLDNRGKLLAAVLTIWRNWIVRGRPEADTAMGSFDRWAKVVGGALEAAGIKGFRSNTADWLSDTDDDDGWRDHLQNLRARFSDKWFTVAQVAEAIDAGYLTRPPVRRDPDKTLAQLLAYGYRKIREKWHGDLRLIRSEDRNSASGGRTWSVVHRHSQPAKPSSGWSVSSGGGSESAGQALSRVPTDHAADGQPGPASSVARESPGHSPATDDTDHPEHQNPAPGRFEWPAGSFGEAANPGSAA